MLANRAKLRNSPRWFVRAAFLEDRPEYDEIGACILGHYDLGFAVAGDGDNRLPSRTRELPDLSYIYRRNITRCEVHSISTHCERNVGPRVDQKARAGAGFMQHVRGCFCQQFQFARRKVFFAQLHIINAGARRLGNPFEQTPATWIFLPRELPAVSNVVEEQGVIRFPEVTM